MQSLPLFYISCAKKHKIYHLNHFQVYSLVVLSIFTLLCFLLFFKVI